MITAKTLSNNTMTVIIDNGQQILFATKEQPYWVEKVNAYMAGDEAKLIELMNMKQLMEKFSKGGLVVSDTGVFYKDMPLAGVDVDRVLAYMKSNISYDSIANYMVRKFSNPSRRAISEMYNFLEHRQMPLTPQGFITAYKGVQADFFSVSSGKEPLLVGRRNDAGQIYNGVGETIHMDRSFVDDDFRKDCSGGLHAGSLQYAKDWARGHNGIIILIEIDPADVVSVPSDCNCSKLRCCKYKVVGTYNGPLPDTFCADYSSTDDSDIEQTETCDNCGETECTCEDEMCDICGEDINDCTCDKCDVCGEEVRDCTCDNGVDPSIPPVQDPDPMDKMMADTLREVPNPTPEIQQVIEKLDPTPTAPTAATGNEVRQEVVAIICEQLGVNLDVVKDEAQFVGDLGADSLDLVELTIAVEDHYGVVIPDELAETCTTVGKAISLVEDLVKKSEEKWLRAKADIEDQSIVTAGGCQCCHPAVDPLGTEVQPMAGPVTQTIPMDAKVQDKTAEVVNGDTYGEGYALGKRNGTRRRKRLYRVDDEATAKDNDEKSYIMGYNDGYFDARWDYVKKDK
jgi:acyl carrier protein